ncbi:MAG: 6-hydroxymethylpterin diphosphokinase MptE-like protein [Promethearchaeota archaeon]
MKNSLKTQIESNIEFREWYRKIVNEFNFDLQKDRESRNLLSRILEKKTNSYNLEEVLLSFKENIQKKNHICVYGCGPSLEESVDYLLSNLGKNFFNNCVNLAADGAARLLNERIIPIDGIITDLDGITKRDFFKAKFVIVHAHGDNILLLEHFKNTIINFKKIIGTTQAESTYNLINPGGFTDGDRILALIISFLLPQQELYLIGMDFNDIVGNYSKPNHDKNYLADPIKLKKLQYALQIIEWLIPKIKIPMYLINTKPISDKFNYLTLKAFKERF